MIFWPEIKKALTSAIVTRQIIGNKFALQSEPFLKKKSKQIVIGLR
jgi:hypothetical protein